jgi:hypothetical protein
LHPLFIVYVRMLYNPLNLISLMIFQSEPKHVAEKTVLSNKVHICFKKCILWSIINGMATTFDFQEGGKILNKPNDVIHQKFMPTTES